MTVYPPADSEDKTYILSPGFSRRETMGTQGPYQREAQELVEAFLNEDCVSEAATERVISQFEDERYIESLETALRNLRPVSDR